MELKELEGQYQLQLAQYDKEETAFENIVEEHNFLEEQKLQLARKIKIINDIVGDRIIWSRQLWRLSTLTPDNIWFRGINVVLKTFRETVTVMDPRKKKEVQKTINVKRPVLEVLGYVVPDEDGETRIFPLTIATKNDPEFSGMFELRDTSLDYADLNGHRVRTFTLEYLINTGDESE